MRTITEQVDAKASDLQRKALTVLEGLGHVYLELLAPQVELVAEVPNDDRTSRTIFVHE